MKNENEIAEYKEKRIILMKSGLIHWVTKETGENASEHLANQGAHSFLRIRELNNITINTAEMEGIYDHKQYEDLCRVKSGEFQCAYGNWHKKKGGECQCRTEFIKKQREKEQKEREAIENKPLSPEEHEASRERMTKINEMACLDGSSIFRSMYMIGNRADRKLRKSTIEEWEKKTGRKADLTSLAIEK